MTGVLIFRIAYLVTVLVGLWANASVYRRARWLYQRLVDRRINGDRQRLAALICKTSGRLVACEALLLIPSIGGFVVNGYFAPPLPGPIVGVIVCAFLANMFVAITLANIAIDGSRDREVLMNSLEREAEQGR